MYDFSLQLRRLHAQILACPPDVNASFQQLVDRVEKWYLKVDRRRFVFSHTLEFYEKIQKVISHILEADTKLDQMDSQKEQIKPEELAEMQKSLLENVKFSTAPIFHDGQMLLERTEGLDASGVEKALRDLHERLNQLSSKCAAFQSTLAKRSEHYRKFTDLYASLYEWTVHVVGVLLKVKVALLIQYLTKISSSVWR